MRKTRVIKIDAEGRDKGKSFLINEMPAVRTEKWATRAFLALARAGIDVPDDIVARGIAGIAMIGLKMLSGVTFADAEPLLDEMIGCVSFLPDDRNPDVVRPLMIEIDINEPGTIFKLRAEVFALHTGFFSFADLLTWVSSRGQEAS